MKAVKFFAVLAGVFSGVGLVLGLIVGSRPPLWALLLGMLGYVGVLYAVHGVRRDLAGIRCELRGHRPARFKKHDAFGYCPVCDEPIAERAHESDIEGTRRGDFTLFERISYLEEALLRVKLKIERGRSAS